MESGRFILGPAGTWLVSMQWENNGEGYIEVKT
jgi:hypothetical protein